MSKTKEEILNEIIKSCEAGLELHAFIDDNLRKLNIVLLNLEIEAARINEANGVKPIARELSSINALMKDKLSNYDKSQNNMRELFKQLKNTI